MTRFGYACMNLTLGLSTSHTLRLANLSDTERVRLAVAANFGALREVLPWNVEHGWRLFRLGQSFIPFASHPAFPYDWQAEHGDELRELGALARKHGQRLSMHPGQYVNPGSPDAGVVERSLAELRYAAAVLDLLHQDAPADEAGVMVLHLGGAYDDRAASVRRFVERLSGEEAILRHLALENDERIWTAAEVAEAAQRLGVPMILDTLHHRLNPGDEPMEAALERALASWGGRRPKLHLSSQAPDKPPGAHSQRIDPDDWHALRDALAGREADVMIEAKAKEQALPEAVVRGQVA